MKILFKFRPNQIFLAALGIVTGVLAGCSSSGTADLSSLSDPPEVAIGERLFLETRFAQFFSAHFTGNVNAPLPFGQGDPTMDVTVTLGDPLPGPFQGKTMNCRGCHLVDEQVEQEGGGMRTYTDFAQRSPIPDRGDGRFVTARNSPPLVNATLARPHFFLHFDGEFSTQDDLVRGTLTGRNFGWLPSERNQAVAHIAQVIREDNGSDELAAETGGWSYAALLLGTDDRIPAALRLPDAFRLDVTEATDDQILDAVAALISAYVDGLRFSKDATGAYNTSPYDVFLQKNGLPRQPDAAEADVDYSRRLRQRVENLASPKFVAHDGQFETHNQSFIFGAKELQGLNIFLRESDSPLTSGVGNCIACHAAPNFTDFRFHNTGVTQREFDQLHGDGAFAALTIPDLPTRQGDPNATLPPTAAHPNGTGKFLSAPSADDPEKTDLGLWNVFANDDVPTPQNALRDLLCDEFQADIVGPCTDEAILPLTIAYFKTPGLRDLGHSAPYMHNGQSGTLADAVSHYRFAARTANASTLRNPSSELTGIRLSSEDVDALVAFLKALNEDYE